MSWSSWGIQNVFAFFRRDANESVEAAVAKQLSNLYKNNTSSASKKKTQNINVALPDNLENIQFRDGPPSSHGKLEKLQSKKNSSCDNLDVSTSSIKSPFVLMTHTAGKLELFKLWKKEKLLNRSLYLGCSTAGAPLIWYNNGNCKFNREC